MTRFTHFKFGWPFLHCADKISISGLDCQYLHSNVETPEATFWRQS